MRRAVGDKSMSDRKKPKLSEIRAHYEGMVAKDTAAFYLLDLVSRMGENIGGFIATHAHDLELIKQSDCKCPACVEAHALLEELKQ